MKKVFQIVLLLAILAVAYFVYDSIQQPLRFNAEQERRYAATIQRLQDIRTAEVAFRYEYKRYTGSFDTLIHFLKNDSFKVVMQIGDEDDSAAVAAGTLVRDTIRISVLDSLFQKGYPVDSIRFVPYTNSVEFELGAADLKTGSEVTVPVFEAKVEDHILLKGLDQQLLVNFTTERENRTGFGGLKVGSLTETTNNAGNWE